LIRSRVIQEILDDYERAGVAMFLLQSLLHCRPAEYESWLREFGLEPFDAQDRVVRDGSPLAAVPTPAGDRELTVERVTHASSGEWVEFIERVYRLETGPWLARLIDRPGWHQYVVREGGEIVAARGMHIGPDGTAWLGMDGPLRVSRPMTTSPTQHSAHSSSPRDSPAAHAPSSPTSRRPQPNRRHLPTRASGGSGSRAHTSARTGRGSDASIELDPSVVPALTTGLIAFWSSPWMEISSGCLTGRTAKDRPTIDWR
jgi:hypothetical protein